MMLQVSWPLEWWNSHVTRLISACLHYIYVVVWHSASAFVLISEVNLRQAWLLVSSWKGDHVRVNYETMKIENWQHI